jgi:o-succinylbenzoate---CoA ligase
VHRLVALGMPAGDSFVDALRRCWDDGDAALPLDPRLPRRARERLLAALRPAAVVGADGAEQRLAGGEAVEEGDALVVATSGTTGAPKGVVLTHTAVAASARATSARLGVGAADRWYSCLPLAHIGGLSVVTRALLTGTPFEVVSGFDADDTFEAANSRGATLVSLVPTALQRLGWPRAGAFRRILLGGSAPPETLAPNVVTTYGMTETGSGVVYDGLALDGVEIRLGDRDEILLRGPMLLRRYRDGTVPLLDDGWLPTGDAGGFDPRGRLFLHGRLRDLVISGGENVWPVAVEAVIRRAPNVAEVAVGGRPDPEWGERVVAFVVAAAGATPPLLDELRELVKEDLGPWAAPRELVLVDSLPRNEAGKVIRDSLPR